MVTLLPLILCLFGKHCTPLQFTLANQSPVTYFSQSLNHAQSRSTIGQCLLYSHCSIFSFVCSWQRPTWPTSCISYWFCYVYAHSQFVWYTCIDRYAKLNAIWSGCLASWSTTISAHHWHDIFCWWFLALRVHHDCMDCSKRPKRTPTSNCSSCTSSKGHCIHIPI